MSTAAPATSSRPSTSATDSPRSITCVRPRSRGLRERSGRSRKDATAGEAMSSRSLSPRRRLRRRFPSCFRCSPRRSPTFPPAAAALSSPASTTTVAEPASEETAASIGCTRVTLSALATPCASALCPLVYSTTVVAWDPAESVHRGRLRVAALLQIVRQAVGEAVGVRCRSAPRPPCSRDSPPRCFRPGVSSSSACGPLLSWSRCATPPPAFDEPWPLDLPPPCRLSRARSPRSQRSPRRRSASSRGRASGAPCARSSRPPGPSAARATRRSGAPPAGPPRRCLQGRRPRRRFAADPGGRADARWRDSAAALQRLARRGDRRGRRRGPAGGWRRRARCRGRRPGHTRGRSGSRGGGSARSRRFFEHGGVNYIRHRQVRVWKDRPSATTRSGGGSTLTMQLARGFFLSPEKKFHAQGGRDHDYLPA